SSRATGATSVWFPLDRGRPFQIESRDCRLKNLWRLLHNTGQFGCLCADTNGTNPALIGCVKANHIEGSRPWVRLVHSRLSVIGVLAQPIDATQALKLSAGVSNCRAHALISPVASGSIAIRADA